MNKLIKTFLNLMDNEYDLRFDKLIKLIEKENIEINNSGVREAFGLTDGHSIYVDLNKAYMIDRLRGFNGHLLFFVILHEMGHMLRFRKNPKLINLIEDEDFNRYYELLLVEETKANKYGESKFKTLNKVELNPHIIERQGLHTIDYRLGIEEVFQTKQHLGITWKDFYRTGFLYEQDLITADLLKELKEQ